MVITHLKLKLVKIILNNSVRTSKRTLHFTISKISRLMVFEKIIAVYTKKHTEPVAIQSAELLIVETTGT
jgi:hypothetical protein